MIENPGFLFTVLAFLAVLGPLVFIHELGHYLVGRWCGIRAETFSIGFGREVLGWTDKRGTRWKVGWMPLGGYVQFAGDEDAMSTPHAVSSSEPEGSFASAALWKRSATVAAGPAANFLLAILILAGFALAFGRPETPPVVGGVQPGSAAAAAGLAIGDRIVSIDGRAMDTFIDIPMAVIHRAGETMELVVERGGERSMLTVTPRLATETDNFGNRIERGLLGITSGEPVVREVSLIEAPLVGAEQAWAITRQMAEVIWQLVTGRRGIEDLGGPLKIADSAGEQASLGILAFVSFVAMISLNLGFVNLLPMPMLDGGHLLFNAIEAVRRRPVSIATQQIAYRAGFAVLATLMIVVTFNDLGSFGLWERLAGLIG
jgi:regulator of sigma E protease